MPRKSTTSGKSQPPDGLRVRNAGLRRVRVADLADAPWNHRTHPQAQAAALDGAIEELGFYGFPDVFEADGTLMLIDGHLRKDRLIAKYGADAEIEVNVTDFDEAEAKKANLTKDPLAALAEQSAEKLDLLLRETETANEALAQMLASLADDAGLYQADGGGAGSEAGPQAIPSSYQVAIECRDEADQQAVFERMKAEGRKCRVLTV